MIGLSLDLLDFVAILCRKLSHHRSKMVNRLRCELFKFDQLLEAGKRNQPFNFNMQSITNQTKFAENLTKRLNLAGIATV